MHQLKTSDKVRLTLTTGKPLVGEFQSWNPEQLTVGTVSTRKEEVRKVERYRKGESHRGEHAALGAVIGFGGGFAIGATSGGGCASFSLCISRGGAGVIVGAAGAVIGAMAGALIPGSNKQVIYAAKIR